MKKFPVAQVLRVALAVALAAYAGWRLLHAETDLFTTTDSRIIGVWGVAASVAGIAWLPVPALLRRFPRVTYPATLTQYLLLILGTTLTFIALMRDKEYDPNQDLARAFWAGGVFAAGMVAVVILSAWGAKTKPLPAPGSAKDAINRAVINRDYGKSTTGHKPSNSDYAYMFATYAASRLNDAEKLALIKCAMDAFGDDELAKVAAAAEAKRDPAASPFGPGPVVAVPERGPKFPTVTVVAASSMLIGAAGGVLLARSQDGGRAIEP